MDPTYIKRAVMNFLAEDVGAGDLTSEAIFDASLEGTASFIAKESFLVAGMKTVATATFMAQNPAVRILAATDDGNHASPGDILLTVRGPVVDILKAERVALNLVQRLCGIASLTAKFVNRVEGLPVRIVDTRKTTPGLRAMEKYAVRVGGGHNHRFNLADGILIKDNHIAACGSISTAVAKVRRYISHTLKIEVEAETIEQVRECLACEVDIIMLDNMATPVMRQAVELVAGKALIEASGGVTLENVRQIAETGVDLVSVGALTHSAPACDISMRFQQG